MKELYDIVSRKTSKITTRTYTTSFSLGIRFFAKRYHDPIYGIYGFVRLADEIVDTFHDYNKKELLEKFKKDTYSAIEDGISLNPILHSFQWTVRNFGIEKELIDAFLASMEMDLYKREYTKETYEKYILGSAEVVGLMCLSVFLDGDREKYRALKPAAMRLGAAFQKVNFLRDLNADYNKLGRSYFPGLNIAEFCDESKAEIVKEIEEDFIFAYDGIRKLPHGVRLGVYLAYVYFYSLLKKIKRTQAKKILNRRVRIRNSRKYSLLLASCLKHSMNML